MQKRIRIAPDLCEKKRKYGAGAMREGVKYSSSANSTACNALRKPVAENWGHIETWP